MIPTSLVRDAKLYACLGMSNFKTFKTMKNLTRSNSLLTFLCRVLTTF